MHRLLLAISVFAIMSGCESTSFPTPADETVMSFHLAFSTCNLGDETREMTNPFTGEKLLARIDDGLTESERRAVLDLLKSHSASERDPDGYYYIELIDGSHIGVGAFTLESTEPCVGFAVECDQLTAAMAEFLFKLSRAGNMSVGSSTDPDVVALTAVPSDEVSERWPSAPILDDPARLSAWLQANCN